MNFQQIILTIAFVILIIALIIVGLTLSKISQTEIWPPVTGDCPDYWVDLSGNGSACLNSHNLGTCNLPSGTNNNVMNFNQAPFIGSTGTCAKYTWASGCNVTWDGITSGVTNPCTTTTTTSPTASSS